MPDVPTAGDGIVTPPGALPLEAIDARHAAQRLQFRHDNTLHPLAPRPGEASEVWAASGAALPLARARVFFTNDGTAPTTASVAVPMEVAATDWEARAGYVTRWRALLPPQPAGAVVRYRIGGWLAGHDEEPVEPDVWAHDGQGFWYRQPGERGITTFAYAVAAPGDDTPAWAREAIIYHIFLDRFHPGDGAFPAGAAGTARHGGTLAGVLQALPYLDELGVTCLWLSPLYAAETYHRYDATDLYRVDPALGGEQELRDLVDAAHDRDMRVILDLVPSHSSWCHPAFEAARRDPAACTASWYTFEEWPRRYRSFLDAVPSLPSFNLEDPGARAHVIGSAVHWLRACGVDGFRLDHAIGAGMDFWVAFRAATRGAAPHAFSVGEVTDTPDALRRYRGRLDSVLDFPLCEALSRTFALGTWSVAELEGFLSAHERYMAAGPDRVSFLDNHDMNRVLFLAGDDTRRVKLAALCQFTLAPTPTVYYGTEVGLTQCADVATAGDAEARRDMPWDERAWDHDLLSFYRRLTRLRRAHAALRSGARRLAHLDAAAGTYAYLRAADDAAGAGLGSVDAALLQASRDDAGQNAGASPAPSPNNRTGEATTEGPNEVLVVFNVSAWERRVTLPRGWSAATCLLATEAGVRLDGAAVALPPLSGAALARV